MRKLSTQVQRHVNNTRKRLRQDMERIALAHRGCSAARGCGCLVDKSLAVLATAERDLFDLELDSYADPETPRRVVNSDNTVELDDQSEVTRDA